MKQEYTDKMNYYQSKDYESLLKSKNILDAKQFLHTSMLYLNYAIITAKLYQDAGEKTISENPDNPFYNSVNILGWNYNAHTFLNKCAFEWFSHISNSLDCLLQYINSALNLGLPTKSVGYKNIIGKIRNIRNVEAVINNLWADQTVIHIQSICNYCKHTLELYGSSSFTDILGKQRDIRIPAFRYRGNMYPEKAVSSFLNFYEDFIGLYLDILDCIDLIVKQSAPVPNRYYIDAVKIGDHLLGERSLPQSIILYANFKEDGEHIEKYWIENPPFSLTGEIEIMQSRRKNIGQHLGKIDIIEVKNINQTIGYLKLQSTVDNSILEYHKYSFISNI